VQLLSDAAALAPARADLSKPAPPLIYDREILCQMLGDALAQMRNCSDHFTLLLIGQDYAYVARSGTTATGAILLRVLEQKITAVRLVGCPLLLHQLQILMALSPGGECQEASAHQGN
jgi:hypothetical protein